MIRTCHQAIPYRAPGLLFSSLRIDSQRTGSKTFAIASYTQRLRRPVHTKSTTTRSPIPKPPNTPSPKPPSSPPRPTEDRLPLNPVVKPSEYPEGYLIYHAGVTRTLVVGVTKVASALLFAFTCIYLVPGFSTPDQPTWIPITLLAGGTLPVLLVYLTSKPFVQFIHLRLPLGARHSTDSLLAWSRQKMHPDTELRLMTMNFAGFPSTSIVAAKHLRDRSTDKAGGGAAKLERVFDATAANRDRPWYMGKKPRWFDITPPPPAARDVPSTVLRNVLRQIREPDWPHGAASRK